MAAAIDAAVTDPPVLIESTSQGHEPAGATTASSDTLNSLFEDLHSQAVYEKTKKLCALETTQNFVVEFDHKDAEIAFDLTSTDLEALLNTATRKGRVRWM